MALELRPNCERCDVDLPPASTEARICSYECTFCAACAAGPLADACPNCGGGFTARPVRPAHEWRPGVSLAHQPASTERHHLRWPPDDLAAHTERLRAIPPAQR